MECLDERDALALLGGRARVDRATLDAHLDACAWCRRLVAEIGRGDATVTPAAGAATILDLERGTTVGRFTIERELGSGSMGVVYAAHDPELDRRVAVKLLHHRDDDPVADERLLREARAMAALSDPNLVSIYEVDRCDDTVFIAMELVDGGTLREWLARAPRTPAEIVAVLAGAGRGLAAAHAAGLVHRDFKPENVLVGGDGRARVTDFGLAVLAASDAGSPSTERGALVTRTGAIVGTPAYMAPEQLAGGSVDARSDQFSFCVALYEALCGQRPFAGATPAALAESIARGDVRAPIAGTRAIRRAVVRGLSADPAARFASMEALVAELDRPSLVRPALVAIGALAIGAIAATWIAHGAAPRDCGDASAELAGIWDDGQRHAVEAAFVRSASPIATDTFQHVAAALDRYSTAWIATHADSCEATRVRGEASGAMLDRRMSCLADRRDELGALVELLAHADPAMVARSTTAVAALVAPATCLAPDDVDDPAVIDPRARAEAADLRARLHHATELSVLGRTAEAAAALTPIAARAETLGLPRLRAEALYQRGIARMTPRDDRAAVADLEDAAFAAQATKLDQLDARATSSLIAAATDAGDLERARRWVRPAQAAVDRLGARGDDRAELAAHVAWLELHEGKLADAERDARVAVDDGCRGDVAITAHCAHLDVLATVLFAAGKWNDALPLYQRNLALVEQQAGPSHPNVARLLERVGNTLERLDRHAEALAAYDRAMAIVGDDTTGELASLLDNSATTLMSLGRNAEAEARTRRALAIHEHIQGADHPDVATTLVNLANVLDHEGRGRDSLALRRRALQIFEAKLGPDHPLVATTLSHIAWQLATDHEPREAEPLLERALAIQIARLGPAHPDTTYTLSLLGSVQLDAHEPAKAVATLSRALDALRGAPPARLIDLQFNLADALWQSGGDHARARALAETALHGSTDPAGIAEIQRWLAHHT